MTQKICPVCDRVMKSDHYCHYCRRFVKHPYVRSGDYYLNESHPRGETDCSYHGSGTDSHRGEVPGQTGKPPVRPVRQDWMQGSSAHRSSLGQSWVPQPSGRKAPDHPQQEGKGTSGNQGLVILVIVIAVLIFAFMIEGIIKNNPDKYPPPDRQQYDVDLGDYTGEENDYVEVEEN